MAREYENLTEEQIKEMQKLEEQMKSLKAKMKSTKENFITVNKEKKKEDALNLIKYIEETTGCKYDKEVDMQVRRIIAENKHSFNRFKQPQEVREAVAEVPTTNTY